MRYFKLVLDSALFTIPGEGHSEEDLSVSVVDALVAWVESIGGSMDGEVGLAFVTEEEICDEPEIPD